MPFWHIGCFELKALEKQQVEEEYSDLPFPSKQQEILPCARCSPGLWGTVTFWSLRTRIWKNSVPTNLVKIILIFSLASTHSLVISAQLPLFLHPIIKTTRFVISLAYFLILSFSCSVVSDSLRPHESQCARPPCPTPTPGALSNSCQWVMSNSNSSSQWCYPSISSSVISFSSWSQSLLASGSFLMSQLFTWGGRSIGVSASTAVRLMTAINDSKCSG